jgi:hypothetical protein
MNEEQSKRCCSRRVRKEKKHRSQKSWFAGVGYRFRHQPAANIFGLTACPTTNITAGTFLVGSGSPIPAEIRDRMEMQIDINTEHSTFFVQSLIAIRAEKRLALVTLRPASFVAGTFSTSPLHEIA